LTPKKRKKKNALILDTSPFSFSFPVLDSYQKEKKKERRTYESDGVIAYRHSSIND
jgi:hypothetical protein